MTLTEPLFHRWLKAQLVICLAVSSGTWCKGEINDRRREKKLLSSHPSSPDRCDYPLLDLTNSNPFMKAYRNTGTIGLKRHQHLICWICKDMVNLDYHSNCELEGSFLWFVVSLYCILNCWWKWSLTSAVLYILLRVNDKSLALCKSALCYFTCYFHLSSI